MVIAIGYHRLREVALPIYIASCITLALLPVFGDDVNGSKAWFDIGPFQLQPVEFAKVALILALDPEVRIEPDRTTALTGHRVDGEQADRRESGDRADDAPVEVLGPGQALLPQ
jgi:hypothetical protein